LGKPIFREGLFQWRNYDLWLGRIKNPVRDALFRFRHQAGVTRAVPLDPAYGLLDGLANNES
jgi:hypothetical protein